MAMIQIGDIRYEATLSRQKDTLSIMQFTDKTLEELEEEFSPETAKEIRVSKRDGPTEAVFSNLDVLSMQLKKEKDTGLRRVTITMRVEQVTQSEAEALQEIIDQQAKQIKEQGDQIAHLTKQIESVLSSAQALEQALAAIEEGVADA